MADLTEKFVDRISRHALELALVQFAAPERTPERAARQDWLYWRDPHGVLHGGPDAAFAAIHAAIDRGFAGDARAAVGYMRAEIPEAESPWSYRYGLIYRGLGDDQEALHLLVRASESETHPFRKGMIRFEKGRILLDLERPEEAIHELEKAAKLLDYPAYLHKPLGIAYSRAGRFGAADNELSLALIHASEDPPVYHELAAVAFVLRDRETVWLCEYHLRRLNAKEADDVRRMRLMLSAPSQGA